VTRRERDIDHADRSGLVGDEREAFLARLQAYDANTVRLYNLRAAEIMDTREAMRLRVDAVIADLVDALRGEVTPWAA
jgi:hypothetical protein